MPTLPNPGDRSNPEPDYTRGDECPSDAEISRSRERAELGLAHIEALAEVLDDLGIWFDLVPVINRLKEEL